GAGVPIQHGLCVIDLDHFALINERYGTAAGDFVLQRVADALKCKLRGVDLLARLDGDRFGVLLLNCAFDRAKLIAEGLRYQIASLSCPWQEVEINPRASVGLIEVLPGQTRMTELLSSADYACLKAKSDGGNRVYAVHAEDELCRSRDPILLRIKEIETALRYDHFELLFQPVLPIRSDHESINYCEVSLRMRTDSGETLAPRDFLPVAERYHLLPDLDRWIVKATIDAFRRSHPKLHQIDIVAVNISAQAVSDEKFLDTVVKLLNESEIPTTRLCFELAESQLIKQWDRACSFIATLKNLGCHIALDGFGLGTYSFQLLKKLPVDFLKIHEDFVRNLTHNSVDYEVVLGILRVAKALRIRTIAGGVTNSATRDVLSGMGVDFAQGFAVEEPRPLAAVPSPITRNAAPHYRQF
ncbi:MAG: EAL domain-containing protein, partial [Gammaproteobacteria bacterium]